MVDIVRADSPPRDDSVAATYDAVPYGSLAFAQTHPDRLATIARIFGLAPPDVTRCRVLELGCASGGNLIPIAFNLPGSRCVGVDLSRRQVEDGRATIQALGMPNITIEHASILDVDRTWGEFDYIICHGVFSWVEAPVQDKILEIARDQLAPNGVAYISYNTYPGWHMREMVRNMLRYHAGRFTSPAEQITQARHLLGFLASASTQSGPFGELLRKEAERIADNEDTYLYHEHLEQTNTPYYFHQFIARAERAGLQYLAEAAVADMMTMMLPSHVADTIERLSPDILHLEQYMDFVRNRQFRQTLLCHGERRLQRSLTPAILEHLLLSSSAASDAQADLAEGVTASFRKGQRTATVTLPASKAAYALLAEQWPEAIAVGDLCAAALERARPHLRTTSLPDARRGIMGDLLTGVIHGIIGMHTVAPPCVNRPGDKPRAHPLAAWQAARGDPVVNAHHEMCLVQPSSRQILSLADGTRSTADIRILLAARSDSDRDGFAGATACKDQSSESRLQELVEDELRGLTQSGLLVENSC